MKRTILFFVVVVSALTMLTHAYATYFDTGWMEFHQPNGISFIGRMWGDEWDYTFQTKEGYAFDKNSIDGYYYFAQSQRDGVYQLSNLRVGIDVPENVPKNLMAQIPKVARMGKEALNPAGPDQLLAVTWTLKVIMVEFQDVHGNPDWTLANFSNMLFSSNYYKSPAVHSPSGEDVYGSLRDYYDAMSNGNLIITGQILNTPLPGDKPHWIRLSHDKSYYQNNSYMILHNEAIDSADARGYDIATGTTTKLVILYAGNFYLSNLNPRNIGDSYIIFERWGGRGQYGSGQPQFDYDNDAPFGHIGVHAHEFGHFFWAIDLYNSPYNIIDWCTSCDLHLQ